MDDREVALRMYTLLAEARCRIERLATTVLRLDAQARIAAFILDMYERPRRHGLTNELSFNLALTQDEMADHLGLTLVHVNRTLRRMREDRLVDVDRQVVIITNLQGLRELLRGLPEPAYVPSPTVNRHAIRTPFSG